MQTVTIGTKNQIVIPKEIRDKMKAFKPGKKVSVYALDKDTVALKVSDKSWTEKYRGIMKEAWKDIDTTKELDKIRDEWDRK